MNLTLEKILSLPYFSNFKLISGEHGLNRTVSRVNILEIPYNTSPETKTEQLFNNRNELVFSAFYSMIDNIEAQVTMIESLNQNGCSGLVLCYVDKYLKNISELLIEKSNQLNFPIILAPYDMYYSDAINVIMKEIISIQNKQLLLSYKINQRYANAILNGSSITNLLELTETLIKKKVYYIDSEMNFFTHSNSLSDTSKKELVCYVKENLSFFLQMKNDYYKKVMINGQKSNLCFSPVFINQTYYGTLIIFDTEILEETEKIAITQAKNNFAILALNQLNKLHYLNNQKSTFINTLLSDPLHISPQQLKYQNPFNLDITAFNYMFLISLSQNSTSDLEEIVSIIEKDSAWCHNKILVHNYNHKHIIILLYSDSERHAKKIAEHFERLILDIIKKQPTIVISNRIDSIINYYLTYNDSQILLNISKLINKDINILATKNYGLYCTLYKSVMQSLKETKQQLTQLFGGLIEYDKNNGTELFYTLKELFQHNCNTVETAKDMYLHKNTVLQRKKKIIEILGEDPFDEKLYFLYNLAIFVSNIYNF